MSSDKPRDFPAIIDRTYREFSARHNELYQFVMHYNDYIYSTHHYGGAEPLTMLEVHSLTYIQDHPGTTPAALIRYWDKTKGAISQIVTRLTKLGLIVKRKEPGNAKNIYLYVTEKGAKISQDHKLFDIQDITKTTASLEEKCSAADIDAFYRVITAYNDVILKDFEINRHDKA